MVTENSSRLYVTRISSPVIVTLISSLLLAAPAAAQQYPSRPIRMVVPFAHARVLVLFSRYPPKNHLLAVYI